MLRALKHWAGGPLSCRDSDEHRDLHCNTKNSPRVCSAYNVIMHSGVIEVSQRAKFFYLGFNSGDRGGFSIVRGGFSIVVQCNQPRGDDGSIDNFLRAPSVRPQHGPSRT